MSPLKFDVLYQCPKSCARVGAVTTAHGSFDTPAFMPVGTQGSVKGLLPSCVAETGGQIILANTYHLMLRPGSELVHAMGGLNDWVRWGGPILTDSGGYQVFSLAQLNRITDHGVGFRSHIDGAWIELTPQRSIQVQNQLGADIIMAFDDCPPALGPPRTPTSAQGQVADNRLKADQSKPDVDTIGAGRLGDHAHSPGDEKTVVKTLQRSDHDRIQQSCERTIRWLEQCVQSHARRADQALFGIVQGGIDLAQRDWCVERVLQHDLPGYAIGGLAVGEGFEAFKRVVDHTAPQLPLNKPRYVMGVGYERDILAAVRAGVDMFDCVLPTRNGRNANAFTSTGTMRLRNARFKKDPAVLEAGCDCPTCRSGFSRSYLRHLFLANEMLGPILVSMHNLRHFQRFMLDIRHAITDNGWSWFEEKWPVVTGEH